MKEKLYALCITNIDPWKEIKTNLEIGKLYEVIDVSMGQSLTYIVLKDFKTPFNSVLFKFFESIDIYSDKRYNPYL